MGEYFLQRLTVLKEQYGQFIKEVRGKGFILGIDIPNKDKAKEVSVKCLEKGLLVLLTQETVIRILPPLIAKQDEIDFAMDKFNESFREIS
jgi:acetylornithine/succinyldiaminopimelate/putrescine aminotransferase